ncbi:MAG TPA: NAD(P)/FAD-dependent oxidoreductase [bacterium]|jgi:flavin-dependent dehydrogenase|nr:NAD(P)/FAD-dependent oxidoreductase [bacterium]
MPLDADVLIIGAGPSGSLAAANLLRRGHSVLIVEREKFPRFSIGESLLPQTMGLLEEAGLLRAVVESGFQHKNGAVFERGHERTEFDFRDKSTSGWGTTYQVQRAAFDKALADGVEQAGARILYRHEITGAQVDGDAARLDLRDADGKALRLQGRFVLDASGNAKVLARLLKLERPSGFPMRQAVFTHVGDNIPRTGGFDRNKILITVHPEHKDVWYWLIPFSNGRCSLGVVASSVFLAPYEGDLDAGLKELQFQAPGLKTLLKDALWDTPARQIKGYSSDVSSLYGPNFALLGNAGEFLDPVFSSGVTIAFKSAALAAELLHRRFTGVAVDWEAEYSKTLRRGVDCFREFVEAWYQGTFQDIIFHGKHDPHIRRMICSILAGYAWDPLNPYVADPRRLRTLAGICAPNGPFAEAGKQP